MIAVATFATWYRRVGCITLRCATPRRSIKTYGAMVRLGNARKCMHRRCSHSSLYACINAVGVSRRGFNEFRGAARRERERERQRRYGVYAKVSAIFISSPQFYCWALSIVPIEGVVGEDVAPLPCTFIPRYAGSYLIPLTTLLSISDEGR